MGRSVEVPSDALVTAYADWSLSYEDWKEGWTGYDDDEEYASDLSEEAFWADYDAQSLTWESNSEWYVDTLIEMFPSAYPVKGEWLGYPYNETRIVAENALVQFTISEYCGMTALSIIPNYDRGTYWKDPEPGHAGLAAHWVKQIEGKFQEAFSSYYKIGTFSNGESVYAGAK
jgi:hypothetical protein